MKSHSLPLLVILLSSFPILGSRVKNERTGSDNIKFTHKDMENHQFLELNFLLTSAIEKNNSQQVVDILNTTVSHTLFFYLRVIEEFHGGKSDETLLAILDRFRINPNFNWDGETIILAAARRGCLAIVARLVAVGADVNWVVEGDYPLYRAAQAGYRDIFEYLFPLTLLELREAAILVFKEKTHSKKLHHCFCYTKVVYPLAFKVVKTKNKRSFIDRISLSSYPEREASLWIAAYWGDEALADRLLMAGTNYNAQIDYKNFSGNFSEPLLWKHGKNLSSKRGCQGLNCWKARYQALTPLMVAIASGGVTKDITPPSGLSHIGVIRLLIKAGADVNLNDLDGRIQQLGEGSA